MLVRVNKIERKTEIHVDLFLLIDFSLKMTNKRNKNKEMLSFFSRGTDA